MDRRHVAVALVLLLVILATAAVRFAGLAPVDSGDDLSHVSVPDGFSISVYADDFGGTGVSTPGPAPGPRFMAFHDGTLHVALPDQGRIVALPDGSGDPEPVTVVDGLDRPHSMAFHNGRIYIAETGRTVSYRLDGLSVDRDTREVVVDDYPAGGQHWTRTIRIHDGHLYISVGSSCNVCEEDDPWRAAITRCDLDGTDCDRYATGLRNTVGFIVVDGTMVGTDNGRDLLGNDVPPDEINVIAQGDDYGWPYCYGDRVPDPAFGNASRCDGTVPPAVPLQAHSAPLGLTRHGHAAFPERYRGDLYVAYHGSWNRQPPTGYKVVRIPYHAGNGTFGEPRDFAAGWLGDDGTVHGRPVDVVSGPDGALYVSDDATGRIYRIAPGRPSQGS